MKITWFIVAIFALVYAVNGKPTSEDEDYVEYQEQMLKDTQDEDYDNAEEDGEGDARNDLLLLPTLLTTGQNFSAKANDTLHLPCQVLNGDNYVIIWRKNESLIFQETIPFGDDVNKYERLKDRTLIIKNVDSNDTGDYICSIPMENQEELKVTHNVFVETAPKIVALYSIPPSNTHELKPGDDLTLMCEATGIPKPKIKWYFKNKPLHSHSDEVLQIDKVDYYKDTGEYRCLADNNIGRAAHSSIRITVQHKPLVTIEEFRSNETIQELDCVSDASPPVGKGHLKWKFNGTLLEENDDTYGTVVRRKNNVLKLIFENFDESNFGKYTCVAKNGLGRTEQTIRVDLLPKKPERSGVTPSLKSVEITWRVTSTPPLVDNVVEYKLEKDEGWKTEKANVISSNNGVYIVGLNFTDLHHGKYVVKLTSSNDYGASEPSAEEQITIRGQSKHRHSEKIRISFEEDAPKETGNTQAAPPNDSVLNDQQVTAQTGSQISSAVPNAVPSLLIFLLGYIALLQ